MNILNEVGVAIRKRRIEMGLSQAALARLSGLSRATVNQIETGALQDLGLARTQKMLEALGLSLRLKDVMPASRPAVGFRPLDLAARSASVSYSGTITPMRLKEVLTGQELLDGELAYVRAVLEEVPTSVLGQVAQQIQAEANVDASRVWQRMRELARSLHSSRALWR